MKRFRDPLFVGVAKALLLGLMCLAVSARWEVRAADSPSPEYKLKALILFNFAKFVEWPTNAFADAHSQMVIGILGDNPFGDVLDEIVRGRDINGHPLAIKRSKRAEDLNTCQIVFLCSSENDREKQLLAGLGKTAALTVSEGEGFLRNCGAVRLTMQDQKVRFEINARAAERRGLKISSQLLDLASAIRNYDCGTEEGR